MTQSITRQGAARVNCIRSSWRSSAASGAEANCLRFNDAVTAITGIELDYHSEELTLDALGGGQEGKARSTILHVSFLYGCEPAMALRPCQHRTADAADDREKLVARVNGPFGGVFSPEMAITKCLISAQSVNRFTVTARALRQRGRTSAEWSALV